MQLPFSHSLPRALQGQKSGFRRQGELSEHCGWFCITSLLTSEGISNQGSKLAGGTKQKYSRLLFRPEWITSVSVFLHFPTGLTVDLSASASEPPLAILKQKRFQPAKIMFSVNLTSPGPGE